METSFVASPLCSSVVTACISAACEKDHPMNVKMFQSPKKLSHWQRRKKLNIPKCSNSNGANFIALAFFGENALFHLFGSKNASITTPRNNRLVNCDAHPGRTVAMTAESSEEEAEKSLITRLRQVVVTGLGVVSSIGDDPDVFYTNLLEGVSGISLIEGFDCSDFPSRIAGEIKSFSTDGLVPPKLSKRGDKYMIYLLTAGKKALIDGGITEEVMRNLDKKRCGVLIGSAFGGLSALSEGVKALEISYRKINPFTVPYSLSNIGSAMLAIDVGWMGPNYSISALGATSNLSILSAANHIISGEAEMMLCGGSDGGVIPLTFGGMLAYGALSQRNNEPTKASRPWDSSRDGFVVGEGAGVLLLEELEHAKRRGATIYAEFLGGSFTCEASHSDYQHHSDESGKGFALCMEKALAQSGVAREDVNYVNANAISSPADDLKEYRAITHCFGKNPQLRVNSSKSMIGHLLGASGAVEAIATVKAIQTGLVHPNINLENPDEDVDMNVLLGQKKECLDIKIALSNSFGFGGQNSSIVFAPYK